MKYRRVRQSNNICWILVVVYFCGFMIVLLFIMSFLLNIMLIIYNIYIITTLLRRSRSGFKIVVRNGKSRTRVWTWIVRRCPLRRRGPFRRELIRGAFYTPTGFHTPSPGRGPTPLTSTIWLRTTTTATAPWDIPIRDYGNGRGPQTRGSTKITMDCRISDRVLWLASFQIVFWGLEALTTTRMKKQRREANRSINKWLCQIVNISFISCNIRVMTDNSYF